MVYVHAYMLGQRTRLRRTKDITPFLILDFCFQIQIQSADIYLHIPLFKTAHNFFITNQYAMFCGRYLLYTIDRRITRELGAVLARFHTCNYTEKTSNIY